MQIYLPLTAPVRAAHYTAADQMPSIRAWVMDLRDRQLVHPGLRFDISHGPDGVPVAVLDDPAHDTRDLFAPNDFLVFTGTRLQVLAHLEFHRHYRLPGPHEHTSAPR